MSKKGLLHTNCYLHGRIIMFLDTKKKSQVTRLFLYICGFTVRIAGTICF